MATMQFTVWGSASEVALGDVLQEDVVTIGGTSLQSAAINGTGRQRRRVRVMCDTDAWVNWGANPTAAADGQNGRMMAANSAEYFNIEAGHLLAVIQRT